LNFSPLLAVSLSLPNRVTENLEDLQRLIPRSYPRHLQEQEETVFDIIAVVFGGLAAGATLVAVGITYRQRTRRVFVFAQVEFVFLLLFGLLLVSAAAVLSALPRTDSRCIATAWLLNVGYSFELVPLIVKIAAINTLMQAAKRMQRIVLRRSLLFGVMAVLAAIVIEYMVVWTLFDPPVKEGEYELTGLQTDDGETIVTVAYFCKSESNVWMLVAVGVQFMLLLCASILAFMTRKMRKDINEANTVSFLIYWNFVCVLLRIILFLLADKVESARLNRSLSMILSADSIATIIIYFVPKFVEGDKSTPSGHAFVSVDFLDMWRPGALPHTSSIRRGGSRVSWADLQSTPRSPPVEESLKKNSEPESGQEKKQMDSPDEEQNEVRDVSRDSNSSTNVWIASALEQAPDDSSTQSMSDQSGS
jgi:hypothetical protein